MSSNTPNSTKHDAVLEQAVRDAMGGYAPLQMWRHSINIQASDGRVVLTGNVRSQANKEIAEQFARSVKGVTAVENHVVVDSDLELAITQALAADARTCGAFPGILVGVVFGVAFLKGTVASPEVKQAAGEIASRIAGVRRVSNELIVADRIAVPA
jgi:osmotically-inducible protein OsmY